jgi:hypothetical protein
MPALGTSSTPSTPLSGKPCLATLPSPQRSRQRPSQPYVKHTWPCPALTSSSKRANAILCHKGHYDTLSRPGAFWIDHAAFAGPRPCRGVPVRKALGLCRPRYIQSVGQPFFHARPSAIQSPIAGDARRRASLAATQAAASYRALEPAPPCQRSSPGCARSLQVSSSHGAQRLMTHSPSDVVGGLPAPTMRQRASRYDTNLRRCVRPQRAVHSGLCAHFDASEGG